MFWVSFFYGLDSYSEEFFWLYTAASLISKNASEVFVCYIPSITSITGAGAGVWLVSKMQNCSIGRQPKLLKQKDKDKKVERQADQQNSIGYDSTGWLVYVTR